MSPYEPRPEGLNTQPAPPSVVETLKPRTYTTKPAESVMGIALRQCGNEDAWREILAWNPRFEFLASCDYFPVGTVLVMPPRGRAADAQRMGDLAAVRAAGFRDVPALLSAYKRCADHVRQQSIEMAQATFRSCVKVGGDERDAYRADMIAAGAKDLGNGTWEWDGGDFLFQLWRQARAALSADGGDRKDAERMFPMQYGPAIPWKLAEVIYEGYAAMSGRSQTLERLGERGGFGWEEVAFIYKDRRGRKAIDAAIAASTAKGDA